MTGLNSSAVLSLLNSVADPDSVNMNLDLDPDLQVKL
jgi:hypothetical protein